VSQVFGILRVLSHHKGYVMPLIVDVAWFGNKGSTDDWKMEPNWGGAGKDTQMEIQKDGGFEYRGIVIDAEDPIPLHGSCGNSGYGD
jgi:hypothetical protein